MTVGMVPNQASEQTPGIAEGIRVGEPAAWEALYDEVGERVYRLLYRLTGDREAALDLTQDTFLRVVEKGAMFQSRGSLHGWVFRIATNLAREAFRRDRTRRRGLYRLSGTESRRAAARDPELRITLERAVAALSDKLRTVLLLYDVDGYSHPEISEMLGIPEGSSKARLSRARAQLRTLLESSR